MSQTVYFQIAWEIQDIWVKDPEPKIHIKRKLYMLAKMQP